MLKLYNYLISKLSLQLSTLLFLLIYITLWFVIGTLLGIIISALFSGQLLSFSYIITFGSLLAIFPGYIHGAIMIIKHS